MSIDSAMTEATIPEDILSNLQYIPLYVPSLSPARSFESTELGQMTNTIIIARAGELDSPG